MGHKTKVGGTAYEIKGGRTIVKGTGYKISKGRTLVNGTGYNIEFVASLNITGTGHSNYCRVDINGNQYSTATSGIEVLPGSSISFRAAGGTSNKGTITIDGTIVAQDSNYALYTWTVPDGVQSINIELYYKGSPFKCTITVTTT